MRVLDTLIGLFNTRHTAREKSVSHKTRAERARFLRRFFLDLKLKAGFHTVPDPRNLGQKHLHAMVQVWKREVLAAATPRQRRLLGEHEAAEYDCPPWHRTCIDRGPPRPRGH
mgnify:CR=1 FL=1